MSLVTGKMLMYTEWFVGIDTDHITGLLCISTTVILPLIQPGGPVRLTRKVTGVSACRCVGTWLMSM
jgi:hypothetical protein